MSTPGTRLFIGPLTEAQARRRMRSRYHFNEISSMMDARNISFVEAIKAVKLGRDHRFWPAWMTEAERLEA